MQTAPYSSMMQARKPQNQRPTIGILIQSAAGQTALELEWQGFVDMARRQDANVICFSGGQLNSPHEFATQPNVLYDLVSTEQLDGIVIWSNIAAYITAEQVKEFFGRFRPLPVIGGGFPVPGYPAVLPSDAQGMREAIVHLLKVHGRRHIAFVRGPENHFGAQERYQAYLDTLRELNLTVDSRLITPALDWFGGTAGMTMLLDERKLRPSVDFDALVGANDLLVLDAMTLLQTRGISIPSQVSVIGYDNTTIARLATPPLTSVITPFYKMGEQAVVQLLAQMRGKQTVEHFTLPPEVSMRQSCGCVSILTVQAAAGHIASTGESLAIALAHHREPIVTEMQRAMGDHKSACAWAEGLLESFVAEVTGQKPNGFLSELNKVLRQVMEAGSEIVALQGALSALRCQTLAYLESEQRSHAEDLWQQARVEIGDAATRVAERHAFDEEQRAATLRNIGASLITTTDMNELMNVLAKSLPRLGIPSCYLALYGDPQKPAEWSRLLLAYNEQGRIPIESNGQRFPSRQLVPAGILPQNRQFNFVVEPLYFRENQLGYVVFEIKSGNASHCPVLRGQISSALQSALLLQARKQAEATLLKERDTLKVLLEQIEQSALDVTSASNEMLASSSRMASATQEQASAIHEITTTVDTAQSSASQVSQEAQGVAASADHAASVAHKGTEAVHTAITGMKGIQDKVEAIAENILSLSEQAMQISQIIDSVTDIAGQSRLLALNAAIEAAHAGESGKRFSVVAEEMKNLSEQSRKAAQQVKVILGDIQKAVRSAVQVTEAGMQQVVAENELVNQAAHTIDELSKAVDRATHAAQQIVGGAEQQTMSLNQISIGMNDVNQAASETADSASQISKTAQALNNLAERLKGLVSQYHS